MGQHSGGDSGLVTRVISHPGVHLAWSGVASIVQVARSLKGTGGADRASNSVRPARAPESGPGTLQQDPGDTQILASGRGCRSGFCPHVPGALSSRG